MVNFFLNVAKRKISLKKESKAFFKHYVTILVTHIYIIPTIIMIFVSSTS